MGCRVCVIGLDAASPEFLVNAWKVCDELRWLSWFLTRSFPPSTPPAWASIMTGVPPCWHGILSFFKYRLEGKRWVRRPVTSEDVTAPYIHEWVGEAGLKSLVINPCPSYPPRRGRNAYVVTHLFFTPRPAYTHEELKKWFGEVPHDEPPKTVSVEEADEAWAKIIQAYLGGLEEASKHLGQDLTWVNLHYPDHPHHVDLRTWKAPDKYLGKSLRALSKLLRWCMIEHDAVIVVSDHGFSTYDTAVSLNDILTSVNLAHTGEFFPDINEAAGARVKVTVPLALLKLARTLKLTRIGKEALKHLGRAVGKEVIIQGSRWPSTDSDAFVPEEQAYMILCKRSYMVYTALQENEIFNTLAKIRSIEIYGTGGSHEDWIRKHVVPVIPAQLITRLVIDGGDITINSPLPERLTAAFTSPELHGYFVKAGTYGNHDIAGVLGIFPNSLLLDDVLFSALGNEGVNLEEYVRAIATAKTSKEAAVPFKAVIKDSLHPAATAAIVTALLGIPLPKIMFTAGNNVTDNLMINYTHMSLLSNIAKEVGVRRYVVEKLRTRLQLRASP